MIFDSKISVNYCFMIRYYFNGAGFTQETILYEVTYVKTAGKL